MITLHGTRPMFGLPQPSPFVMKVEVLLKMSGLPYEVVNADFTKAPKGKIPWIVDGGEAIADSRLIRHHLETRHGVDFSAGYDARALGIGLMAEQMMEHHLYWLLVETRWANDVNFAKGPAHFFDDVPAPLRPVIRAMIRRRVRRDLAAEGLTRLDIAEKKLLAGKALRACADLIEGRDCALGAAPSGTDATLYPFLASLEAPFFTSPYGDMVRAEPVLMDYIARMKARWYPQA